MRMDRLKEIREARGLTQTQLADLIGVEQPTISRIEKGKRGVSLELIHALADALNVETSELFRQPAKYARVSNALAGLSPEQQEAALQSLEAIARGYRGPKTEAR